MGLARGAYARALAPHLILRLLRRDCGLRRVDPRNAGVPIAQHLVGEACEEGEAAHK